MKKSTKTPKSKEFSYLYKTTFSNGDVYFHRFDGLKSWTENQFISHQLSCSKSDKRNDNFAKRVQTELSSVLVERVFYGTTKECIDKKRELISQSKNTVVSTRTNNVVSKTKDNILRLKKEFTKVMSSGGDSIVFIDTEYGFRMGLKERMLGGRKHPIYSNYVSLNTTRVERF